MLRSAAFCIVVGRMWPALLSLIELLDIVFEPDREAVVNDRFYHRLCEPSGQGGYRFRGMARTTIVRAQVMRDEFETVGTPGGGRYVPREAAAGSGS